MLSILDLRPSPEENSSSTSKPSSASWPIETAKSSPPPIIVETRALQPEPVVASTNKPQPETRRQSETRPHSEAPVTPASATAPLKKSVRPLLRTAEVPVSEPVNIPEEPSVEAKASAAESKNAGNVDDQDEYELVLGRRQIASWLFVGTVLIAGFSTASYYIGRMSVANPLAELDGKSAPYVAPDTTRQAPARLPEATFVLPNEAANSATNVPANPAATAAPSLGSKSAAGIAQTPATNSTNPNATAGPSAAASAPAAAADPAKVQANSIREWNRAAGASYPGISNSNDPPIFAAPQTGALYLQMGAVEKGMAVVLAEGLRRHGFPSFVAPGPSERIFRVLIGPFTKQEDFKKAKAEVDAIDLGTFARRFEK